MGINFKMLFGKKPLQNSQVATILLQLDGHVILSRGDYDYRYNILDPHHKKHNSKSLNGHISRKEWAFGHLIVKNENVYFSERPTSNGNVEKHIVSDSIYKNLSSHIIFDIDRNAKLIDTSNAQAIVNEFLKLSQQKLLP